MPIAARAAVQFNTTLSGILRREAPACLAGLSRRRMPDRVLSVNQCVSGARLAWGAFRSAASRPGPPVDTNRREQPLPAVGVCRLFRKIFADSPVSARASRSPRSCLAGDPHPGRFPPLSMPPPTPPHELPPAETIPKKPQSTGSWDVPTTAKIGMSGVQTQPLAAPEAMARPINRIGSKWQ
jgi:hypothetical protein